MGVPHSPPPPPPPFTSLIGSWRGKTSDTWNERWFLKRFLGDWVLSFGTWKYGNRSSERSFGKCRCIPYHFKLLQMLPRYFQTSNPSTSIGDMQSSWRVKKCRSSFDICTSPIIHLHLPPKLCISIVFCLYGDHYNSPETSKTKAKQPAKRSFVGQWELCKLRLA